MSKFRVVFGEPVKRGPNGLPVHEKGKPDWRGTQNTKVEAASAKEAADKVRKMHPGCEVFESVTDPLYKIADAFTELRKDADALVSRRDALERGRKDAPSTAEEQKKWKIRGVYPDGRKLEFSVLAFDHSEAKRKAETKKCSGKITDVVCLS